MKLSEYIRCIENVIKEDGDLECEGITIDSNAFNVKLNGEWMYNEQHRQFVVNNIHRRPKPKTGTMKSTLF